MADSCLIRIDKLLGLIDDIDLDSPIHLRNWSEKKRALSTWILLYAKETLTLLRAMMCYISNWSSGDDKPQDLAFLLSGMEAELKGLEDTLEANCAKADLHQQGDKGNAIINLNWKIINKLYPRVRDAYGTLEKWAPRPRMSYIVFDEFVTSVQAYLQLIPDELDAYYHPGGESNVVQFYNSSTLICQQNDWPSSQVHECVAAITRKLEILKCFLLNFAKCGIDVEENLQPLLDRAAPLVFSTARLSWKSRHTGGNSFPFRTFSVLSRDISPHNQEVKEIYSGVLQGYVEILNALEPPFSEESTASLRVEQNRINSFLMCIHSILKFCHSTKDRVPIQDDFLKFIYTTKDRVRILGDVLAFPLEDLKGTPEDCTEDLIELFLKGGIAGVVRQAGCLGQSVWAEEMHNDLVAEANVVLSKVHLKIQLIKAEVFLLALHNHKADLMVPVTDGVSAVATVGKAMGLLREFLTTPEPFLQDSEKSILALIEDVLTEATSDCNSYQAGSITKDVISESSIAMLKLFKAEATLMVLINNKDSMAFLAKYKIESLHKGLILLRALLSDPLNKNLEDGNFSTFFGAMADLVSSFGDQRIEEDLNRKMSLLLPCLPSIIDLNIAEVKAFFKPIPWSLFLNISKCDGFGFLGHLLGELRELLARKPETITFMHSEVQVLLDELELVMSLRKDVADQLNENTELGSRLICLLNEAEYIIDLFVTGGVPLWYHQLLIINAVLETKVVKTQVSELCDKKKLDIAIANVEPHLRDMAGEPTTPNVDETIVGVDDEAQFIINQLTSKRQQLDIVSIVGMAGLGKTTLAKRVYGDASVGHHFRVRGWCCVSQVYRKRELILEILGCFDEITDKIKELNDWDLSETLRKGLKGKRFLIVMDDVWTIEPWNDLKHFLQDDKNGSRVLFTSRLGDVALQANPTRQPHPLRLLDDKESRKLLLDRVFHGGSYPEELFKVAGQIASSCKGLPLAIVVVAGLLEGRVRETGWWNEIAGSLRSHILDDPNEQLMRILEKSYHHLPYYLKPCFLYLGAFLEDRDISVQKLKLLWIAEGFVPKVECKSLEETAEKYWEELIGRSLVTETRRRSKGGTKSCRMHDMIRDLCLDKARKENFMQLVSRNSSFQKYRFCVHSARDHFEGSLPIGRHARSLLFFPINNERDVFGSYDLSFISHKFKLLRVLNLEFISFREPDFPTEIALMFRLRYLAIKGRMSAIPSSIAKLWNLETLIVKGSRGEIALPAELWSMERLRYVRVHSRAYFSLPDCESMRLVNLSTLSSPVLSYTKDTEKLLRNLIGLKKLRCIFVGNSYDNLWNRSVLPASAFLTHLESLKILYHGRISYPCKFSFPKNLKKLTLSMFRLPWKYISAISQLTNLEVLKLLNRAFEGEIWDMAEEEFPNLKFFKLEGLNLATWSSSGDHFPNLERLVLQSCKNLKEVPSSFGEILTLQMIEIHWCCESAAKSVETVYEQQREELQNADFKVMINPPEWDFRAAS